jgi:Yip1-like protein
MAARAEPDGSSSLDRQWWLNTLVVLHSPRQVFSALRDDSDAPATARQEPMAAIVFLGGISAFLSTSTAAHLFDDFEYDALLVVVESIFAGAIVGLQNYWLGGGALYIGARWLGSTGSYRSARHMVGLAMTPLVVALLFIWPVTLAVYGSDLFRTGGGDTGAGRWIFHGLWLAAVAWGLALLLVAIRVVHRWTWLRSLGAGLAAAVVLGATVLAFAVL